MHLESNEWPSVFQDLPEIYGSLLPSFFQNKVPEESIGTCNDCTMLSKDKKKDITKLAMKPYREDTKCCTYYPTIPSYLVGGALDEASPEGRERLQNVIAKKVGVIPFGLMKPKLYDPNPQTVYFHYGFMDPPNILLKLWDV